MSRLILPALAALLVAVPAAGQRRVPKPEYLARLEALEASVKAAEDTVALEERKLRLGPLFF